MPASRWFQFPDLLRARGHFQLGSGWLWVQGLPVNQRDLNFSAANRTKQVSTNWYRCALGRTFNSTTTCLTRFWMHLGIRIRHIPKKVGKNIVFQCHETIEAAEILCYKFIKGQIELSLFLGKQPFSLTKCECRGLNDKNWLGKISFRPLHSHLVSENGCFPKKVTTRFVLL